MTGFGGIVRGDGEKRPRIAIVGGGFSGTLVLVNLIELAAPGTIIELFEARAEVGPGTAYGTPESAHLLNVRAGRMGALASQPGDFLRWLQSESGLAHRVLLWPGRDVQAQDYLPRALYAAYLMDLLAGTLEEAARRGVAVRIARATVLDASLRGDGLEVTTRTDGKTWRSAFDALVLATGNFPPKSPRFIGKSAQRLPRLIADVWHPAAGSLFPHHVAALSNAILILGTGLTAVDAILTLRSHGFRGKTIAVSRHGRLPAVHVAQTPLEWKWGVEPDEVASTAYALLRWLKGEANRAAAQGADWRSILDTLRPLTQTIWRKLDADERRRILRRHSLWSVHRHRMAPQVHAQIDALQKEGTLEVVAARISSVGERFGGLRVELRRRGAAKAEVVRPSLILNCTGPEYDVAATDDPLLRNLLRRKLIVRSTAGAGIAIGSDGAAQGSDRVFAVGPLLVGELFECTSVPELRDIARAVAERVAVLADAP